MVWTWSRVLRRKTLNVKAIGGFGPVAGRRRMARHNFDISSQSRLISRVTDWRPRKFLDKSMAAQRILLIGEDTALQRELRAVLEFMEHAVAVAGDLRAWPMLAPTKRRPSRF